MLTKFIYYLLRISFPHIKIRRTYRDINETKRANFWFFVFSAIPARITMFGFGFHFCISARARLANLVSKENLNLNWIAALCPVFKFDLALEISTKQNGANFGFSELPAYSKSRKPVFAEFFLEDFRA